MRDVAEKPHDAVVTFDTSLAGATAASRGPPCDSAAPCLICDDDNDDDDDDDDDDKSRAGA